MRKVLSLLLLAVPASGLALGSGAAWLGYPATTRSVSEAGGLGVMSDGLQALDGNPAGLAAPGSHGEAALSVSQWPGEIRAQHLGTAVSLGGHVRAALTGTYVDFGEVQSYTYSGGKVVSTGGVLRPTAGGGGGALALQAGDLQVGAALRLLYEDLTGGGSSTAPSLDLGARYRLASKIWVAANAEHLGTALSGSPQPGALRLGLAWRSAQGMEAGVEMAQQLQGSRPDLLGAMRLHATQALTLRMGWQQMESQEGSPSVGATFNVGSVDFDYGFKLAGPLGGTHHVGLGYRWG